MSDNPTTPDAPKPTEPPTTPPAAIETPPAQETDWKAEARKWEDRAKSNVDKASKYDDLVESQKTEAQKQADALAAAQAKVKQFESEKQVAAWKADVSKDTGVPAAALAGSTLEEITAHAETLKPLIAPKPGGPVVPNAGDTPPALNSTALEDALRRAIGSQD